METIQIFDLEIIDYKRNYNLNEILFFKFSKIPYQNGFILEGFFKNNVEEIRKGVFKFKDTENLKTTIPIKLKENRKLRAYIKGLFDNKICSKDIEFFNKNSRGIAYSTYRVIFLEDIKKRLLLDGIKI